MVHCRRCCKRFRCRLSATIDAKRCFCAPDATNSFRRYFYVPVTKPVVMIRVRATAAGHCRYVNNKSIPTNSSIFPIPGLSVPFSAGQRQRWTLFSGGNYIVGYRMCRGKSAWRMHAHIQIHAMDTGKCEVNAELNVTKANFSRGNYVIEK